MLLREFLAAKAIRQTAVVRAARAAGYRLTCATMSELLGGTRALTKERAAEIRFALSELGCLKRELELVPELNVD